jgi:hypothetical protein
MLCIYAQQTQTVLSPVLKEYVSCKFTVKLIQVVSSQNNFVPPISQKCAT